MDKKVGIFLTVMVVILSIALFCVLLFLPDMLRGENMVMIGTTSGGDTETEDITSIITSSLSDAGTVTEQEPETISETKPETIPETEPPKPQADLSIPWHEQYSIVAHALGCVEGRTETNSREAFLESYALGQRVFEVDLTLTSDNRLVARHDFEQMSYYNLEQTVGNEIVMDYETHMAQKIKYKYTPLDIDGVLLLLSEHPDTYLITDTKETGYGSVSLQFTLLNEAVERIDPSLRERIIVQIYNDRMFDRVKKLFPCKNWIFTLYQIAESKRDYDKIGDFCIEKGIDVVTVNSDSFNMSALTTLHEKGLKVYYHTVNRLLTMVEFAAYGADGFYSDYVTQDDFDAVIG